MKQKIKKQNNKQITLKPIPQFKNEDAERDFWAKADSSQYFDWSKARHVIFPNLKLTKKPISLRITTSLLARVKTVANKKDMPYQTLIKQYIEEGIKKDYL